MKEFIIENMDKIIALITMIITWSLGKLSKKSKIINNNYIPIQNFLIGLAVALIEWYITGTFDIGIALSGLLAGGTYDVAHNIAKMKTKKDEFEDYRQEELNADETEIGELEEKEDV